MNDQKKEATEESWFEEMIRLNSRFPEVNQEKQELPNRKCDVFTETDEILKRLNPQTNLDTLVQKQIEQNKVSKETTDEVSNNKVVLTPYMYTPGYQNLRNYWLCLPTCIQQAIATGGEFILQGIGLPDENLLEEFRKTSQIYLDYYFPTLELEAVIKTPEYQGNGNLYKEANGYRLSIQKREKIK